jgi:hypothetical protein
MVMVYLKDEILLDVAGVLTIIYSCFALLSPFFSMSISMPPRAPWGYVYESTFVYLFTINIWGFSFGLTGGILALLRQRFTLTTSGMIILLSSHLLSVILPLSQYPQYFQIFDPVVVTTLISILALAPIITIKKRKAFS